MSEFEDIISNYGIVVNEYEESHILKQEQALIIEQLETTFQDDEYKRNKFIESFKTYCDVEEQFHQALFPCHLHKTKHDSSTTYKIMQDSLFGILLRVESLQTQVLDIIMEKLNSCVIDSKYESWVKLLTNSLKSLPFLKDDRLSSRILDSIEIAEFPAQLEILANIPDIIPEVKHDQIAKELNKLLNENSDLNAAIVECLNSLNLSYDCRILIVDNILKHIQIRHSLKCFPILFDFVVTECKVQALPGVLLKCRTALDILLSSDAPEMVSLKIMSINEIVRLTSIRKYLLDAWLTMLSNVKHHNDHKPVDIFLFIMLHEQTVKVKRRNVETIFKKHITSRILRCSHLEKSKQYLLRHILDNYSYIRSIVKLMNFCLLSTTVDLRCNNDKTLTDFWSDLCRHLFCSDSISDMNRRHILHSLMVLVGQRSSVGSALSVLKYLCDHDLLNSHQLQIMGLLEFVNGLSLPEVRRLFEVLCQLTCSGAAGDTYKDEVHMVIRKQLASCREVSLQVGIIAAVVMADCLVTVRHDNVSEKDSSIRDDSIEIADLPSGPVQDAASLLNLARAAGRSSPELLGLFYDQIAHMVLTSRRQHNSFVQWLFNTVTNDFQDVYVVDKEPSELLMEMPLRSQMSLNTQDEMAVELSLNIAGLTNSARGHIIYLSPFFRSLRLLHNKLNNGDLSTIDALLGSAVIMPPLTDIDGNTDDQIKYICDCLFHCINWFREVISAFITQRNKCLRMKVIQRVENLIDMENLLQRSIQLIPDHKLPSSYFHDHNTPGTNVKTARKVVKAKKRPTSNETVHNDTACTSQAVSQVPAKRRKLGKPEERTFSFRDLDTDLVTLLKYQIKYNDEVSNSSQGTTIALNVFRFILTDFVDKMRIVLNSKNAGLSSISVVKVIDLVNDCQTSLPRINYHFLTLRKQLTALLKDNDDRYDLENVHTNAAVELKQSFGLVLEFLHVLLSWTGFHESRHMALLRECLNCIVLEARSEQTQRNSSNFKIIEGVVEQLSSCSPQCMHLGSAVSLIKTMQVLNGINENCIVKKIIVTTSLKFLERTWYDLKGNIDTGKSAYDNMEVLVKAYLEGANIYTILALVGKLQNQVDSLRAKEDYLYVLGSINKSNFFVLFQCICFTVKGKISAELKSATNSEHLVLWKNIGLIMQGLITILKIHRVRNCYRAFMIVSTAILKIFISTGIPIFEIMLRGHTDEVVENLRIIQTTTRFVHNLCCDAKEQRDTVLLSKIPMFKLVLETLIYKVKTILVANNCSAAFWMGNLKNRNLDGDVILSQSTVNNDGEVETDDAITDMALADSDEELLGNEDDVISSISDSVESEVF